MKNLVANTFGRYPEFETPTAPQNKDYHGVFIKTRQEKFPSDKGAYKCLGYFQTYRQASNFQDYILEDYSRYDVIVIMSYNPIQGK